MEDRSLRYVMAIAQYQNITKAAEALYVGQPTLSKFLITLEKELGLKLFRKLGNRYVLTYAGERYVERAAEILRLRESLDAEMADILKRDVGVLHVAFAPVRGSYMLPAVLPAFQKLHPQVNITVMEGTSAENDRRLLEGQADLAFYSRPAETNERIEYRKLGTEELLLCTAANHPLVQRAQKRPGSPFPWLDLSFLEQERVLLMKPEQRTRQITDSVLREHNIHLNNTFCSSSMQAIMGLAANGYGVAFLFDSHLRRRLEQQPIACFRYGGKPVICDFVAAWRKGSYLPRYAQDLIDIVQSEK